MEQRVRLAITLMEDELRRELSLAELARAVYLSPSRFQHLFKAETGTTPVLYLRRLRLEHAKGLLETSLLPIKQIMRCVGFKDRSHFEREFKKLYGLTPTQYRATALVANTTKEAERRE